MLPIRSLDLVDGNITQTLTGWTYFLHFPVTGRVARAFSGVFYIGSKHVVSVFFGLEKAYDTTWKYGIMKDLHGMDLRGRLPLFIKNFLSERTFRVRVGTSLSDFYDQEMGVPQGSILSVTLLIVKINSITSCIRNGVDKSLFVDDFGVSYRSNHMQAIERQLQLHLNTIEDWADHYGFKFSQLKTVCVHFCRRRGLHPDPNLVL